MADDKTQLAAHKFFLEKLNTLGFQMDDPIEDAVPISPRETYYEDRYQNVRAQGRPVFVSKPVGGLC